MSNPFPKYQFAVIRLTVDEQVEAGRRLVALRARIDAGETGESVEESKAIREQLTTMMLPTIIVQAKKRYGHTEYYTEDLIASAVVQVLIGCDKYNPDREDGSVVAATTYLWHRIRLGFALYMRNQHHTIRPPACLFDKREPIVKALHPSQIRDDGSSYHHQFAGYLEETAATDDTEADDTEEREATAQRLRFALGFLPTREREIIVRSHGIGCDAESFATIGRDLGLSRERIRQLEDQAMRRLRKRLALASFRKPLAC